MSDEVSRKASLTEVNLHQSRTLDYSGIFVTLLLKTQIGFMRVPASSDLEHPRRSGSCRAGSRNVLGSKSELVFRGVEGEGFPFRQFFVTCDEPRGTNRVQRCSMGIDLSGEMGESRFSIGLRHAFGMQGSLVQIQSSRPKNSSS
jgi:hypothetical protein